MSYITKTYNRHSWKRVPCQDPGVLELAHHGEVDAGVDGRVVVVVSGKDLHVGATDRREMELDLNRKLDS